MKYNKVLFVSPPSNSRYGGLRVPAGIGYLAQALFNEEIDYGYVDMRIGYSYNYLSKVIKSLKPDLIGVSMITLGYKHTYKLIDTIKKDFPDIDIVVGGHHVTILKEEVLNECSSIDLGVVHEGEETLVEICKGEKEISNIKGVIHRVNGNIVFNGYRELQNNLDSYSFPRYYKFDLSHYSKQIPISSSRGCVQLCTFCPNKLLGRKFRKRSVNNFVDEIEYWRKLGYKQFAIDDDNFTLLKERVFEICDEIENRGLNDLLIRCSNGIRADRVDREMLKRMMDIGVREVGFGVDGGNNKVLKDLKKGETFEQIEFAVKTACELGLDVKAFIIVGTPKETVDDIYDCIKFARKYPIARVNFNNAIPYPGTEMFDYVKDNNLFIVQPEVYLNEATEEKNYPVFETPELPAKVRRKMLKLCHEVEIEVMKNTAIRMFKKIPFSRFLIKHFFYVDFFEKLFFKNLFLRNIFEKIRYNNLLKKNSTYILKQN